MTPEALIAIHATQAVFLIAAICRIQSDKSKIRNLVDTITQLSAENLALRKREIVILNRLQGQNPQ